MSKENIRNIKFQFDAHIGKLTLPIKFPCKIKLSWKRSSQQTEIEPLPLTNGVLDFNRQLTLNVNMYYDNNQQKFLQKKSLFSLIIITEKGEKAAGYVTVDFAEKLNERVQEYSSVYQLEKCPMKEASLEIAITSHPISEQDLDSLSQMTTAPETVQLSTIGEESVAGESFYSGTPEREKEDKYSNPTKDSLLSGGGEGGENTISDNLLRINDVSAKINDFVAGFSNSIKGELGKLKEKNKVLEEKVRVAINEKQDLEVEMQSMKIENRELKARFENAGDDHAHQIEKLNASLLDATSRVEQAEQSKKALESANLAGENEQIQYLNQQITQKQQTISKLTESKNEIVQKLEQQKQLNNDNKSKISNLELELASLQQKYSTLSAAKNELQSERRNNEEEVEAAKHRLERVYEEMLVSLKDLI